MVFTFTGYGELRNILDNIATKLKITVNYQLKFIIVSTYRSVRHVSAELAIFR